MAVRLAYATLSSAAKELPPPVRTSLQTHLIPLLPSSLHSSITADSVRAANEQFLAANPSDPSSIAAYYDVLAYLDSKAWKDGKGKDAAVEKMAAAVKNAKDLRLEDARRMVEWCRDIGVDGSRVREVAKERFPKGNGSFDIGVKGEES
jgi:hypothetical protein